MLDELPAASWTQLEQVRQLGYDWSRWGALQPRAVVRLGQLPCGWAALGMASLHRSGYVREAAVRELSLRRDKGHPELRFLILRLNDWVLPVRQLARDAVVGRLHPPYADAWMRALPLVSGLRRQRRVDHTQILDGVAAMLRTPGAKAARERARRSFEVSVRREGFRFDLSEEAPPEELVKGAFADSDVIIRCCGVQALGRLPAGSARAALVRRAFADPASLVRRRAIALLDGEEPEARRTIWQELLADATPQLRRLARAALPEVDAAAQYRALIGAGRRLRGAIAGLGECGSDDDVWLLEPLLKDPRARVRGAALTASAVLDPDSVGPGLEALPDPSKRISSIAASVLSRRWRIGLPEHVLAALSRPGLAPHAYRNGVAVLASQRSWPRLLWLLRAAASSSPELAAAATAQLDARMSEAPMTGELESVEAALAAAPLHPSLAAALRRDLQFWKR
jgi:alkylhydroperoxidase/carboxymuconolactone decarboxylase family protein YurZ